eukprot:GFUD01027760.1.p1 GENE.GFUD01027760.1~~GFUD01027760.1.p1  ORF type:complete len:194 (-),score=61.30 GFUD01027760.1:60-641(-)
MENKDTKTIKVVVVGDGAVGKTAMMMSYMTSKIPTDYQPTVVDTFSVNITVEEEEYTLEIFDTAGQEDFDRIRSQSFPDTDVFLVCFSTISKVTLENVKIKWIPEIRSHDKTTPIILVGTKIDLNKDTKSLTVSTRQKQVTREEAEKVVKKMKLVTYLDCSATTQKGLKAVFDEAIVNAFEPLQVKNKRCAIL